MLTTSRILSRRVHRRGQSMKLKSVKCIARHKSWLFLNTLSTAALYGAPVGHCNETRHSTVLLHAEWLITIPGGLGLNKSPSHLLRLKSVFPQGITLSHIPSIMHQNLHHKSLQKEPCQVWWRTIHCREGIKATTKKKKKKKKNPRIKMMSVFVFLCSVCYLSWMFVSRGMLAEQRVIRHLNWLRLESNCSVW